MQETDWLKPLPLPGSPTGVEAFYTLRGDEATPHDPYSGFSVCHYTGDDPLRVACARKRLANHVGVDEGKMVFPRQVHSVNVMEVRPGDTPQDVDAIFTREPDTLVGVSTADCVPVVLAEPSAGIVCAVHAGWRGAVGGVVQAGVEGMVTAGASRDRIVAAIGPCICTGCFEVGEEVASRFDSSVVVRTPGGKPHVDLAGAVRLMLLEGGLPPDAIAGPPECTRCNPMRLFSARALGISSGRVLTGIVMRNPEEVI